MSNLHVLADASRDIDIIPKMINCMLTRGSKDHIVNCAKLLQQCQIIRGFPEAYKPFLKDITGHGWH